MSLLSRLFEGANMKKEATEWGEKHFPGWKPFKQRGLGLREHILPKLGKFGDKAGDIFSHKAFKLPTSLKAWKPGRQRGLGLGNLAAGVFRGLGDMGLKHLTPKFSKRLELLSDDPEFGQSLRSAYTSAVQPTKSPQIQRGRLTQQMPGIEDFWEEHGEDPGEIDSREIVQIFSEGNEEDLGFLLQTLGYSNWRDILPYIMKNRPNILSRIKEEGLDVLKDKDALFDEFTPTFSTARRGGGFGVEKLLDTMKKNMQTKLTGEFGNWRGGAYRDAANQILQEIGMSSERADG